MNTLSDGQRLNAKLRAENRQVILEALAAGIVDWAFEQQLFQSCLNCQHWTGEKPDNVMTVPETCSLYGQRPPARIIVTGCSSHTDRLLP